MQNSWSVYHTWRYDKRCFIKTQMNADFRKGKQIDNKDPQSFNLRLSAIIRVSSKI